MYICDFSRSVGAGRATTRKTRGLTRSVIALIVPPLPAPSLPSNMMQIFRPLCLTHSCTLTSSTWSRSSSSSYSLRLSFSGAAFAEALAFLAMLVSPEGFCCRDPNNSNLRLGLGHQTGDIIRLGESTETQANGAGDDRDTATEGSPGDFQQS